MRMRKLTIGDVISAVGGEAIGCADAPDTRIEQITLDSRTAGPGSLFVAIVGSRSDGHDYVRGCFETGAVCCLVEREVPDPGGPCILVSSTLQAIRDLAAFYRGLFDDIPFIGITGSVGKTTTKQMISSVLAQKFNVHHTEGNLNNEIGVPITIFGLREGHEAAVIEMGISDFGEMDRLSRMVRPDIAVITVIGHAHLENLGSREGVLRAKSEIFNHMPLEGTAILCGDDDLLAKLQVAQRKFRYGLDSSNAVRAENISSLGIRGTALDIVADSVRFPAEIPAFGSHMVYAALAAASVGLALGLLPNEIAAGIAGFKNVGNRADIRNTGFLTYIDDCYNANPDSMGAALHSLSELPGRRVAVLGDMGELGAESGALHREVGRFAAALGIDCLLSAGKLAEQIYQGFKEQSAAQEAWYFPDREELALTLPQLLRRGDAVLVKASRFMQFEKLIPVVQGLK